MGKATATKKTEQNGAHTPGPWGTNSQYGNGKRIPIVSRGAADREALAWVDADDVSESESQANVRLIAAAPDLLAEHEETANFLVLLRDALCGGLICSDKSFRKVTITAVADRADAIRAAIAKARGVA